MPKSRKNETIAPGCWVALTLRPGAAPLRCYVGQVQATDALGVRITLVDWMIGTATGYDLFAPWSDISSALVATPEHDLEHFRDAASKWQSQMDPRRGPAEEED